MSAMIQAVGNCGCTGCASPTLSGTVYNCLNPTVGATVEAHDNTAGGTTLATTTTDGSGNYTLSGMSVTSGNAIVLVVVASGRFAALNYSLAWTSGTVTTTTWKCGTAGNYNLQRVGATGYHCSGLCDVPLMNNLQCTVASTYGFFPGPESGTLVYGYSTACMSYGWSHDFLDGFASPPCVFTQFLFDGTNVYANYQGTDCEPLSLTLNACPPALNITGNVIDSGGFTDSYTITE